MEIAFGIRAHSGWAVLVGVGKAAGKLHLTDRCRVELVEDAWARQPYHSAENLESDAARRLVENATQEAHRIAAREMHEAISRELDRGNRPAACAVLAGDAMPAWSVEEILAVHFRMHKAEGFLFKNALVLASQSCGLKTLVVPEKSAAAEAVRVLGTPEPILLDTIAALGKSAGPPWGKDQKTASLAAMIALQRVSGAQ
jgi:hypothetical protein